jgi:hypothetical protein
MVYSPKLNFVAGNNISTDVELTLGKTIWIGILDFTTNRFGNLSLSPR